MNREIKIWGERWLIRKDSTHAVSFLDIRPGYRCSWHVHKTKFNLFVVLEGELILEIEELGERNVKKLTTGEEITINPGQWHEFSSIKGARVIEEMYVEYNEYDIEREKTGSKL